MARILYGISPIGLGHVTRSLEIVDKLKERGMDVSLVSGGKAAEFIRAGGLTVHDLVSDPVPRVVKGEMKDTSAWYIRSWLAFRNSRSRMEGLYRQFGPDLVVGDEEFTGISIALREGVPAVFVSDELELGFARGLLAGFLERRVLRWYKALQARVSMLIVPEAGVDEDNVRHVGTIVRRTTRSKQEVQRQYGLPSEGKMVLLSMSGSGIGEHLLDGTVSALRSLPDNEGFLVITGNRGPKVRIDRVYDLGVVPENQNLVAAADLVVSTAGKSTMDEAACYGTPIIVIPIRHHAEQERNAAAIGFTADDASRLPSLVADRIGKRTPVQDCDGAARAADLILTMLPNR